MTVTLYSTQELIEVQQRLQQLPGFDHARVVIRPIENVTQHAPCVQVVLLRDINLRHFQKEKTRGVSHDDSKLSCDAMRQIGSVLILLSGKSFHPSVIPTKAGIQRTSCDR